MGIKVDLTGKVFGKLTVIEKTEKPENLKSKKSYWKCKCTCGEIAIVSTSNLNTGHTTKCWTCSHYESNKYKRVDYTGQTFGELSVLEMIYPIRGSKERRTKCRCKCSCGKEVIKVIDTLLTNHHHQSCGCKRYERMINACATNVDNKKIGRLLILETIYDLTNHNKPQVKCLCDCGKTITINKNDVVSGKIKSCGCLRKDTNSVLNEKDWTNIVSDSGVKFISFAYQNSRGTRLWNCECPLCNNTFISVPAKIMSGHTTSCGCKIKSSLERITELILIKNNIKYLKQYSFDDCVYRYRLKFDFVVLNDNNDIIFAIENDGRQHYEPVEYFGGEKEFEEIQIRDNIKNEYCKSHNIPLLRIPYYLNKEQMEIEIKKVI